MSDKSNIEWTDATWNPITGCSVVSPGCTNCYAMKLAGTRLKHHPSRAGLTVDTKAGPVWNGKVRLNEEWLDQPLRWKKPRMIFVCAHGDLFAEGVIDEWIDKVFLVMAKAHWHTYQVLTKRPDRMRDYLNQFRQLGSYVVKDGFLSRDFRDGNRFLLLERGQEWPLHNVWCGVSAEDQTRARERIPLLRDTPAAVRWVSAEPLLGPIETNLRGIDWLVAGGESGPDARPMHPDWARSLRDQCDRAGVAFFFKQWGAWAPSQEYVADASARNAYRGEIQTLQMPDTPDTKLCIPTHHDDAAGPPLMLRRMNKREAGRLLDGVEHNGMPGRAA